MNDQQDKQTDPPGWSGRAVCEVCGAYDAFEIGDHWLCLDCYEASGSCCPEFGREKDRSS